MPVDRPAAMASADFLQFAVSYASRTQSFTPAGPPPVFTRSSAPSGRPIYLQRFRIAIGLRVVWHPYPRCRSDGIPVRRPGALPAPSFRFHLTMDTRCSAMSFPLSGGLGNFNPFRTCACGAHPKKGEQLPCSPFSIK